MKVDINYVKHLLSEIDRINEIPFNEVEWFEGDRKLDIPQKVKDRWRFVGMTNCSFVEVDFMNCITIIDKID